MPCLRCIFLFNNTTRLLIFYKISNLKLLERVKMQLASFLEDPQYQDQYSLHTEIIKTFGRVGPNAEPRFRDECKLHFSTVFSWIVRSKPDASLSICHVLNPFYISFHILKAESRKSWLLWIARYYCYWMFSYTIYWLL